MVKRALGYVRVSTQRQAERGVSPAVQRERIAQYCARHGYTLLRVYEDHQSGRRVDRGGYQALVAACRQHEAEAVVVMFIDRFGRSLKESARRWWELEDLGVELLATEESQNPAEDDGQSRLMSMVYAQRESRRTGERVRGAMAYNLRETAGWLPGRVPYGWSVERTYIGRATLRRIDIDEAEAEVVRRIARRYLDGLSSVAIAAELNADGRRLRAGQLWTSADVHWLLRRPHNSGAVIWGRHQNADGRKELLELPDKLPALLDTDTLAALRERMAVRSGGPNGAGLGPRGRMTRFVLTGILVNGDCGHAMVGSTGGRLGHRVRGYICTEHNQRRNCATRWTNADRLERSVCADLIESADAAVAAAQLAAPRDSSRDADARQARAELAAADRDLLDNMRLYRGGSLTEQQLAVYNAETGRRRDAAEQRLRAIEREQAAEARRHARLAALPQQVRSLLDGWEAADVATRKAALQQLVARVTVFKDGRVELLFRG